MHVHLRIYRLQAAAEAGDAAARDCCSCSSYDRDVTELTISFAVDCLRLGAEVVAGEFEVAFDERVVRVIAFHAAFGDRRAVRAGKAANRALIRAAARLWGES